MDDLIKRLRRCYAGLAGYETDQGDYGALNEAAAALAEAQAEIARLRDALRQIVEWSDAYPTYVFPEPDFARAASALSAVGMSLDIVSASNMRHATKGVGAIASAALTS